MLAQVNRSEIPETPPLMSRQFVGDERHVGRVHGLELVRTLSLRPATSEGRSMRLIERDENRASVEGGGVA